MANEVKYGVRRDGSYYTRVDWTNVTEKDPTFWVNNIIDDDITRCGGTWGANSETTADVVLSFFGEEQEISKFRFFKNVGLEISVLEELAKVVNIYVSNTDEPAKLRREGDDINSVAWQKVASMNVIKEEGWQEVVLDAPVNAKYVRIELCENFCDASNFIPWIEISEVKIYG